jgi:hypothetical protein
MISHAEKSPSCRNLNTLIRDRVVVPVERDSWIAVLRHGFDGKAWGEVWERDLLSDAGIDFDDEAGVRKLYTSPRVGPRLQKSMYALPDLFFVCFLPHPITRSRPLSRRPNNSFLRRTITRTDAAWIATRVGSSALSQTCPRRWPPASSGPWARRPSRCRRSSVLRRRWRAAARAPPSAGAWGRRHRLSSGARRVRTRSCRTSSRAC